MLLIKHQHLKILWPIIALIPPLLQEVLEPLLSSLRHLISHMACLNSIASNIHG